MAFGSAKSTRWEKIINRFDTNNKPIQLGLRNCARMVCVTG